MEVKRFRNLALEIFKTLNNLNPEYMKEIFYKTTNLTHRPFNIKVNQNNTTKLNMAIKPKKLTTSYLKFPAKAD